MPERGVYLARLTPKSTSSWHFTGSPVKLVSTAELLGEIWQTRRSNHDRKMLRHNPSLLCQ